VRDKLEQTIAEHGIHAVLQSIDDIAMDRASKTRPSLRNLGLSRDLPDDALLTEHEVASVGRWSTNTLASCGRQPGHPLQWDLVAGKYFR
jgi:hypothetical protein